MPETSQQRRRRKLAALCRDYGIDKVAAKAGINPAHIDQIIKGVLLPAKADGTRSPRGLGNAKARAIENAFPELGAGWFDGPDDPPRLSDEGFAVGLAFDGMSVLERQRLRLLWLAAIDGVDPPIKPAPGRENLPRGPKGTSIFGDMDDPPPSKKR